MEKKRIKLKLKKNVVVGLKVIGGVLAIILIGYFIYAKQISTFTDLKYSKAASKEILFSGNKEYVLSVGENKTLDAAFRSKDFKEKYLTNYTKIKFQEQKNIIKNINTLLEKGYSNNDVSIILAHGNDKEVTEFAKRERIKYLEEFYQYPYAKLKNYDRYLKYTDETGEDEKTTVIHVNLNMDKEKYVDYEMIKKFSFEMLVNKYHSMGKDLEPDDLITISKEYTNDEEIQANRIAVNSLLQMFESAKIDGYEMVVNSAYRSYEEQEETAEFYRKWYGDNYVTNYVAKPGFSEHQTGLSFDIGSTSEKVFIESKEYEWMQKNAYKYGFILRFPKKGETITGFRSEPWHYRYVGKDIAKYMHEHAITFEEYYVMFLDK